MNRALIQEVVMVTSDEYAVPLCQGVIVMQEVTLGQMMESLVGAEDDPGGSRPRVQMWVRRGTDFRLIALEVVITKLWHPLGSIEYEYECVVFDTSADYIELLDQPAKGTINFVNPFKGIQDWMGTFRCEKDD